MELLIDSESTRSEGVKNIVLLDLTNKYKMKLTKVNSKRTPTQNRSLHLFFKMIAIELNRLGITYVPPIFSDIQIEVPYNEHLVKESLWRPIQMTMFNIESTTELDTMQINAILDVLSKFFGDRGVSIHFPSKINLIANELEKNGYY